MTSNEAERRRWNDEGWTAAWPKREALTDAVTPYLIDALALQTSERVLDIGSGGGKPTIAAARAVAPTGVAVGADISRPLTELATRRAEEADVGNASFCVADVQVENPTGGPFDVAMSQFGVMFFDEPVTAFSNIHAQLEPGGRLVVACWQSVERNPWFFAAVNAFVPPPPEPAPGKSPTGPFALADPDRTADILDQAGFGGVTRTAHSLDVDVPEDSVFEEGQLEFLGVAEENLPAARDALESHMARFRLPSGLVRLPLRFQIFRAAR